jgi:outer membrane immunogenic protein
MIIVDKSRIIFIIHDSRKSTYYKKGENMKKMLLRIIGFSCAVVFLFTGVAISAERGPYVSGQLGISFLRDSDLSSGGNTIGTMEFDKGWGVGAAAGYNFGMFRAEGEVGYQKYGIDKASAGPYSIRDSGDVSGLSFLANGYFDFVNKTPFTPYLSAGIGVARVDAKDFAIGGYSIDSDDTVFAYQVGAGVGYAINKNMTIDLKYRYFATTDPEFGNIKVNVASHNVYLGFRYNF